MSAIRVVGYFESSLDEFSLQIKGLHYRRDYVMIRCDKLGSYVLPVLTPLTHWCHTLSMLKRNKHAKRPSDVSQLAKRLVDLSTNQIGDTLPPTKAQISMLMAELGRKGGKIGGKKRLQTMTPKERSEVARRAAEARWKTTKP